MSGWLTAPYDPALRSAHVACDLGDEHVRTLVDLMLLELLAVGQADGDRQAFVMRAQHLRVVELNGQ